MSDGIRSGRELNPVESQVDSLGQLHDEHGEARHATKQAVTAGDKRDQDLPNHALLPDDRFRQLSRSSRPATSATRSRVTAA